MCYKINVFTLLFPNCLPSSFPLPLPVFSARAAHKKRPPRRALAAAGQAFWGSGARFFSLLVRGVLGPFSFAAVRVRHQLQHRKAQRGGQRRKTYGQQQDPGVRPPCVAHKCDCGHRQQHRPQNSAGYGVGARSACTSSVVATGTSLPSMYWTYSFAVLLPR